MMKQTALLRLGFDETLAHAFQRSFDREKYLFETWQQLIKDFSLAGIELPDRSEPKMLDELLAWIQSALPRENHIESRANLLYRIDLPEKVVVQISTDSELALAIIVRVFQKVWWRRQFSGDKPTNDPSKTS